MALSKREFLKTAGFSGLMLAVGPTLVHAAAPYKFVRIAGLAEQAVGESLLTEIYKRAGIDMTITALPGKRALQQASSGAMDGETLRVYGLGERVTSLIRVPTALSKLQTVGFALDGADITLSNREDLKNYKSAIAAGVLHTIAITEGIDTVTTVNGPEAMYKLVEAGRVDLALTSYLDGMASLKTLGFGDIVPIMPALNEQPLYHYVHEDHVDLIDKIEPIAAEMAATGEMVALRESLEEAYLASL